LDVFEIGCLIPSWKIRDLFIYWHLKPW
jgi:hypothetical protein